MGVQIGENVAGGVSSAGQSGPDKPDPLLFPDDFDYRILAHVTLQLFGEVRCK